MNLRMIHLISNGLAVFILLSACAPAATPTSSQTDIIGTHAAELASQMLTQTVAAYSPTPSPSLTPVPTATATSEPTPFESKPPTIKNGPAPCYVKPSTTAALTSNISNTKAVELLAVGSTTGWYKIMNPYFHTPCWVSEEYLDHSNTDLSTFPIE
jgi:hypothetical protein